MCRFGTDVPSQRGGKSDSAELAVLDLSETIAVLNHPNERP
jgi:hypothetical protein